MSLSTIGFPVVASPRSFLPSIPPPPDIPPALVLLPAIFPSILTIPSSLSLLTRHSLLLHTISPYKIISRSPLIFSLVLLYLNISLPLILYHPGPRISPPFYGAVDTCTTVLVISTIYSAYRQIRCISSSSPYPLRLPTTSSHLSPYLPPLPQLASTSFF